MTYFAMLTSDELLRIANTQPNLNPLEKALAGKLEQALDDIDALSEELGEAIIEADMLSSKLREQHYEDD